LLELIEGARASFAGHRYAKSTKRVAQLKRLAGTVSRQSEKFLFGQSRKFLL